MFIHLHNIFLKEDIFHLITTKLEDHEKNTSCNEMLAKYENKLRGSDMILIGTLQNDEAGARSHLRLHLAGGDRLLFLPQRRLWTAGADPCWGNVSIKTLTLSMTIYCNTIQKSTNVNPCKTPLSHFSVKVSPKTHLIIFAFFTLELKFSCFSTVIVWKSDSVVISRTERHWGL